MTATESKFVTVGDGWTTDSRHPQVMPNGAVIVKSSGGWSGTYSPRTTRPYAIKAAGALVTTAGAATRTFASKAAAAKFAATLPLSVGE